MIREILVCKVNEFCDTDHLEKKKQLRSDIIELTNNNLIFKKDIYLSSFNTMILAHYDVFRLSKIKTSKTNIIGFIDRYQNI